MLDDAKREMEQMLDAEIIETETGELEVKGVFRHQLLTMLLLYGMIL